MIPETTLKSVTPAVAQDDLCEIVCIDEARVRAVAGRMPSATTMARVAEIFSVLADPTRARIVFALSQAELCVCDLASLVGISISAVSHQLRLLRSMGLVRFRKEGRLVYYALTDDHTQRLLWDVLEHLQGNALQQR